MCRMRYEPMPSKMPERTGAGTGSRMREMRVRNPGIGSNYEQSKHFYVDLLGFSIIRENYRPERDDYKIDLQLDEMELELFIIKNCPKRPSYPEAYGLRHLAFAVDSVDDTVRELNKRGIITEPIRLDTYTGKRMTFFHDPDNLPLEIHE